MVLPDRIELSNLQLSALILMRFSGRN